MVEEEVKKPKRHPLLKFLVLVFIFALGVLAYFIYDTYFGKPAYAPWEPIELTQENLPANLQQFAVVGDLPSDARLQLTVGQKSYVIEKASVREGTLENADIYVTIPASYLTIMGQHGWCAGLQQARVNGDLGIQLRESTSSLAIKYSTLLKYKDCLG